MLSILEILIQLAETILNATIHYILAKVEVEGGGSKSLTVDELCSYLRKKKISKTTKFLCRG